MYFISEWSTKLAGKLNRSFSFKSNKVLNDFEDSFLLVSNSLISSKVESFYIESKDHFDHEKWSFEMGVESKEGLTMNSTLLWDLAWPKSFGVLG